MKKTATHASPSVDFDLRQLQIFQKVVELGSFSKAGEAVHLAQASVSERIANLEDAVGARLLDRLGRQVSPTKLGELLYKHSLTLLEMKRHASLEIEAFLGITKGTINLGCSTIPGEYILPNLIGRFRREHPSITVSLTIGNSRKIEAWVLEGRYELGIIGSKSSSKTLISHELWRDELVVAVSASHPWAGRKTVSHKELSEAPYISREAGSGTLQTTENYLRSRGIEGTESFHIVARFGTSTAVKEGIKAGLGFSIISYFALDTEIKTGILTPLRVKDLVMFRRFYLIKDRRRTASPLCKAFAEFLLASSNIPEVPKLIR
ncbi:MAG: LysR family transcriptional regulator [Deltaproteobacteria bacterium]|nr:LysR family transcriptional regulator [Deltaproteobacteria bacterium]